MTPQKENGAVLCCRCRRESPPGKFCKICGGLLGAVPLSGKMPEPIVQAEPQKPAVPESAQHAKTTAFGAALAAAAVILLAIAVIAVLVK